jgi:hypothetical protein
MLVPQMQINHAVADAPNGSILKRDAAIEPADPHAQNAKGIVRVFNDRVPIAQPAVERKHQGSEQGTIRFGYSREIRVHLIPPSTLPDAFHVHHNPESRGSVERLDRQAALGA